MRPKVNKNRQKAASAFAEAINFMLCAQKIKTKSSLGFRRGCRHAPQRSGLFCFADQYMPPPAGAAGSGAGISVTTLSVVSRVAATEAAFCKALRVTLVGSMMPLSIISV